MRYLVLWGCPICQRFGEYTTRTRNLITQENARTLLTVHAQASPKCTATPDELIVTVRMLQPGA